MDSRRSRRILLFTPSFEEPGGAQARSRLIARGLVARGWDVSVIARAGTLHRFHYRREEHLRVLEVPGWKLGAIGGAIYLAIAIPLGLFWGRKATAMLSVQLFSQTTAACLVGGIYRRPFLCFSTTSGSEVLYVERSQVRRLRERILRRAAWVVTQTPTAGDELLALVPSLKIELLPNPVLAVEARPLTGEPAVLFAGRLAVEKGLFALMEAWKAVLLEIPEARLVLAGVGGAYRSVESELRSVIKEDPALAATVHLPGWVGNLGDWFDRHDVFVLPSITEGLSNSLLEACARGRVVVASDIGPNRFVLGDDYPLLFQAEDPLTMSTALKTALTDPDVRKRAARAALENSTRFSMKGFLDRCEGLITDAARSSRH